jgi:ankyrin repeat protein
MPSSLQKKYFCLIQNISTLQHLVSFMLGIAARKNSDPNTPSPPKSTTIQSTNHKMHGSTSEVSLKDMELSDDQKQYLRDTQVDPGLLHERDLPLHQAAYKGDNVQLSSLLTHNIKINSRSINDFTALQLAIRGDHGETVRMLLSAGADTALLDELEPAYQIYLDAVNSAAWLGAPHALGALLDFGVRVPVRALFTAASRNHVDCMSAILDHLGQRDFCDGARAHGLGTALARAALCWHLEAVEVLLVHLAGSEGGWRYSSSALVSAARKFNCDDRCRHKSGRQLLVMETLIAAGADVNWELPEPPAHQADFTWVMGKVGQSVFWACLDHGFIPHDVVRLLLDSGLQLDKSSSVHQGRTPFFGIVMDRHDDTSLVQAFLDAGAGATARDSTLSTPLHCVAQSSFAKLLFAHGADLFAKNRDGTTPLHMACTNRRLEIVQFLLSKGASLNETATEKQRTPLLFATDSTRTSNLDEQAQLVRYLVARGADVRVAVSDGRTVLHDVARTGDAGLVRLVIEHGVDVCAVTSECETALHSVCKSDEKIAERLDIIRVLVDHGIEVNAQDHTGSTALHFSGSCSRHYGFGPEMFNLLVEKGADKSATDLEMRTPGDLVDMSKWMWDEHGMLRQKSKPVFHFSARGGGRGGRGRWK